MDLEQLQLERRVQAVDESVRHERPGPGAGLGHRRGAEAPDHHGGLQRPNAAGPGIRTALLLGARLAASSAQLEGGPCFEVTFETLDRPAEQAKLKQRFPESIGSGSQAP